LLQVSHHATLAQLFIATIFVLKFVLKSYLSKTVTFLAGDTFVVNNFQIATILTVTQNFIKVTSLDLWLVKIMVLQVLYWLDVLDLWSFHLAGLDAYACLLVKKFDESIVGHVFTSIDKPLSLNFNVILDLLKVFVQCRLHWSTYSFWIHIVHVWEAHTSEFSIFIIVALI